MCVCVCVCGARLGQSGAASGPGCGRAAQERGGAGARRERAGWRGVGYVCGACNKLWAWLEAIGLSPHQAGGQSRRCPLWASQMMAGPIIGRPARQCEFE